MKESTAYGLSANTLKLVAITAMLADHFAWLFLPTYSVAGQLVHVFGRMTIPIMCFFVAQGYYLTRSRARYAARLAVFALLSQPPFHYFLTGNLHFLAQPARLNVLFTLLFALLSVWLLDKARQRPIAWLSLFLLLLSASFADWSVFAVLFTLVFAEYRKNRKRQMLLYAAAAILAAGFLAWSTAQSGAPFWGGLFQFGLLLPVPLLLRYNGQRGGFTGTKWFFYLFYPLHLLVLAGIHSFVA